ncbi:nuclear pore complex protein Nup205-like [Mytilus trossulus]|uniref:nuclear pore complex protein Nup205-like n=1 Tax=Mytilus trossulus TaxID=6551 RepID=UPI003006B9EE
MASGGMAVNSEAQLWGPYKELERTVDAAVRRKQVDAVHDLEVALKRHKPDFISLLKNPPKSTLYRDAVKKSHIDGLPVKGEQIKQTFPREFIEEALIISDLFDMSEIAAVELLMAGDRKQSEFPELTRGLIAVLLYFDGQKSIVNSLRTLLQCREGRTWTMELSSDLTNKITQYTDQLIVKDKLVNKILDLLTEMDWNKQLIKLQSARAVGPPKHKKQLQDIYSEIKLILADCLFCLASQRPLEKEDTLRLIAFLKQNGSCIADGTLDLVTLCLIITLLYCFDVSVLEDDNNSDYIRRLPLITDGTYIADVHKELTNDRTWSIPGLQGVAQLSWGLTLRQLSQYQTPAGVNEYCEEDEIVISMATDNNVFHFLDNAVVAIENFHHEEFYLRKIHGLITDFIFFMPLKVKELRNRSDEVARLSASQNLVEESDVVSASHGFEYLLLLIGDIYGKDPLGMNLSVEYWFPQESNMHESVYHYRSPQKQVSLNKFVRLAGDLLPPSLYVPYINMLTGLASNTQSALHCFELLKANGLASGGPSSSVSWNHIFVSLNQYYSSLRRETPTSSEVSQRAPHIRGITLKELEGLVSVLRLANVIAEKNENCRIAFCENQQWSLIVCLFGLLTCSVPPGLKAQILLTLSAIAKTPDIAANLWQTLEVSQIIPTTRSGSGKQPSGLQIELEEIETRNEEYPMILAFLGLINSLSDIPVPAGSVTGLRSPGFDPYLSFIRDDVFLKFDTRAYKDPAEKWKVASAALEIFVKLLKCHEIRAEDFTDEMVELQTGGTVAVNKSPGHTLIIHMLNHSGLLKKVLRILDDVAKVLETYTNAPGKKYMEKASLCCLQLIEFTLDKAEEFFDACREMGVSIMVSQMDRLLRGINPRTGKSDHLINVARYTTFNQVMPYHAMSAMKILFSVSRAAGIQADLVNLYTADQKTKSELLHGFVECLEVDDPEVSQDNMIILNKEKDEEVSLSGVRNSTRQYLLHTIIYSLEQPAPNLAHYLLGFELSKPVNKTNLQDPGILGSQKTCLHSLLTILDKGIGTLGGPQALIETPKLSELFYKLVYMLAANKDTSAAILRYLRTSWDFLYRHLQHVPFNGPFVTNHQSWLLRTVAIELRMTTLNRQRSHTQRLMKLLLDDHIDDPEQGILPGIDETVDTGFDKFSDTSYFQSSFHSHTTKQLQGRQIRRKILSLLDSVEFTQVYPQPLTLEYFDPGMIEQVIQKTESKTEDDTIYCNVKLLHSILLNELSNVQSNVMVANRPRILEEVQGILKNVVSRNSVRKSLSVKQQSYDAWRQVAEIWLTSCPEDLMPREIRQTVLFELLQELLSKVAEEDALTELTAPVSGTFLTLMANLKQCFVVEQSQGNRESSSKYSSMLEDPGSKTPWVQSSGSRTLFATSLQLVLKGLIDHVMCSGGGQQRVRANLYGALLYYLQIAEKPKSQQKGESVEGIGERLLSGTDSEYDQLTKENVATILSYGNHFMDTVCRDACDGHDVGRMLALSVLDKILSMDKFQQWLNFMTSKGYLQHLVDSLINDDNQLQSLLGSNPQLKVLYIYESKMSLLTRIAESTAGAHALLRAGIMSRLSSCNYFDMRPETSRLQNELGLTQDEFIPSPMARYRLLLFACLKLCLAILTSCGIENQDAGNQVLQFVFSHGEIFLNILRDRQPPQDLQALKELSLTTAVIARAQSRGVPDVEFNDFDTLAIEFRAHKMQIERQMISLFPKFCLSEKLTKQWKNFENGQEGRDIGVELLLTYLEISANVTSYCRTVISASGLSSQYCRILFGPSLEEALSRDIRSGEDYSVSSLTFTPSLGVIVYQLRQCASNFMYVYDSHQQHQRKQHSSLSTDDLKEYSGVPMTEKIASHQRQQLARRRLSQIVNDKWREMQQLSYIIENCIFILWRHLEYYLVHCVPTDQQPSIYQVHIQRQQQMRRLQDLTGSPRSILEQQQQYTQDPDEMSKIVSREELAAFKSNVTNVVSESLLKKIQEINQSFCKNRSHYGFVEALIRRLRRLLRLHT